MFRFHTSIHSTQLKFRRILSMIVPIISLARRSLLAKSGSVRCRRMYREIALLLLFLFSGCTKQKSNICFVKESEAKLSDFVTPVNAYSILTSNNSLTFFIKSNKKDLIKFYQENLEIYGWKSVVEFDDKESILVYEKPHKYLCLIVRDTKLKDVLQLVAYFKDKD